MVVLVKPGGYEDLKTCVRFRLGSNGAARLESVDVWAKDGVGEEAVDEFGVELGNIVGCG
jgi:hypothetical protein